ncbi:MAG TPA: hypothetical protein VN457_04935 [Chlamydiales bacterium]|nr:hypothetical protein [Chlamydiales bacterium]
MSHKTLLRISGAVWFAIGLMLLNLGLHFIMEIDPKNNETMIMVLIVSAVLIGHFKGRFMLGKVAAKSFDRISKLPNPTNIQNLYTKGNLIVIGLMMLLGMSIKYVGLSPTVRGFIDVAVGTALIQGSMRYFAFSTICKNPA